MKIILLILIQFLEIWGKDVPLAMKLDENTKFSDFQANCFLFNKTSWEYYDLNPISKLPNEDDYIIITDKNTSIYFNFCRETNYQCGHEKSILNIKYSDGYCRSLQIAAGTRKFWNLKKMWAGSRSNTGLPDDVLLLTVTSDEKCYRERYYSLSMHITCDPNIEFEVDYNTYNSFEKAGYTCEKTLRFISRYACGVVPIYPVWKFYMEYSYFFGCNMIIFGFYILLRGMSFKRVTSILYGCNFALFVLFFYVMSIFTAVIGDSTMWYVAVLFILIGIGIGVLMNRYKKVRAIMVGGMAGFILGTICYYLFFAYLSMNLGMAPRVVYAIVMISGFCILALPSLWMKENTIFLFSNPICGSCAVLRVIILITIGYCRLCRRNAFRIVPNRSHREERI
jgi:hypothetical protein